MKRLFYIFLLFSILQVSGQSRDELYRNAYNQLTEMLKGKGEMSFKKAVFSVENAYSMGMLDTIFFNSQIKALTLLAKKLNKSRILTYDEKDKEIVSKYASLFSVMNDTIPIVTKTENFNYIPFRYDFEDVFGHQHWNNMFVTKLLETRTGNCHSLPYLYKILAEELGVTANLALAPNHFYIKHKNVKNGWYNTELTSGIFPVDAWLMASGFIHIDAISNGVYMKALNDKESIALCLVDLAQGYQKSAFYDNSFVLEIINTSLKYFPNNVNAMIVKVEAQKIQLEELLAKRSAEFPKDIYKYSETTKLLQEIEKELSKIHRLGYRKMPEEMYLDWLVSLKKEKSKYANKNIHTFTKSK